MAGASNSTRGLFFGGVQPGSVNTIEFVTIASLGDAIDFGDLSDTVLNGGAVSNKTRGVFYHGSNPSNHVNTIEYVTIQTLGDAIDFGDISVTRASRLACFSDSHGGLGD